MAALRGRKPKYETPLSEPVRVLFTESQHRQLIDQYGDADLGGILREIVLGERVLDAAQNADVAPPLLVLPILADIPAGNMEEAFSESPTKIQFNGDWQRELSATEGDVLFYVHGQSMEDAHIPDGALILVEPTPRHQTSRVVGRPCVVQIVDEDGNYHVTLKTWRRKGDSYTIEDGAGKEVELSFKVREMWPFGVVKRAIIEF